MWRTHPWDAAGSCWVSCLGPSTTRVGMFRAVPCVTAACCRVCPSLHALSALGVHRGLVRAVFHEPRRGWRTCMARVLCSWALYAGFFAVSLVVTVIKAGQILGKKRAGSSRGWENAAEHPLQLVAWRGCAACGPLAAVGFEMENHGGVLPSAMYLPW